MEKAGGKPIAKPSTVTVFVPAIAVVLAAFVTGMFTYIATKNSNPIIHLDVEPLDLGREHTLPSPIVKINNEIQQPPLNFHISGDTTVIVDVMDALNAVKTVKQDDENQKRLLKNISDVSLRTDSLLSQINTLSQMTIGDVCPGGAHGAPLPHSQEVSRLIAQLTGTISEIKSISKANPSGLQ